MAHFRQILKNKNFFRLWVGQIISQFGDRLNQMALIALVYQKSPGSTVELAKLALFIVFPVFIIGPIAGAYVDRWNRKHIMIISDILRGFLVLLIPLCIIFLKNNISIYILVFIIFSITRFFLPSKMAIIPSIVKKEELLIANSLSDTTRMIATVISLGFAGILVKLIGVIGSFYIDSLSFFISAILLSTIKLNETGRALKNDLAAMEKAIMDAIKRPIFTDIKNGFAYFLKLKKMRSVTFTLFLFMSGLGAIFCVVIVFIQNSFGTVTTDLGFLGMFFGGGLFVGAVFYGRFGQRLNKNKVIFTSLAADGLGIIIFALLVRNFHSFSAASISSFIIGLFIAPIIISTNTLVHEVLPEDARGRVFSSLEAITHLGFIVFMLLTSFLAEFIGRTRILIAVGSIFAIIGISGVFIRPKK